MIGSYSVMFRLTFKPSSAHSSYKLS